MAYATKLVTYKAATLPSIPGGEQQFLANELKKIAQAVTSLDQILTKVEAEPLVTTKAGAPTTTDVPLGTWKVINDTTGGTVGLYANIGGVLKSVLLA